MRAGLIELVAVCIHGSYTCTYMSRVSACVPCRLLHCVPQLVSIQAVFQHSCADYVWAIDSDTYVMNMSRSILDVVLPDPRVHAHSAAVCNTSSPDIIAAGACMVKINGGSIIWRNSEFTKTFLDDSWHSKALARPVGWREQAAIWHMYKQRDNKQHVCIVKARTINAYPDEQNCHDGRGTYKVRRFCLGSRVSGGAAVEQRMAPQPTERTACSQAVPVSRAHTNKCHKAAHQYDQHNQANQGVLAPYAAPAHNICCNRCLSVRAEWGPCGSLPWWP